MKTILRAILATLLVIITLPIFVFLVIFGYMIEILTGDTNSYY